MALAKGFGAVKQAKKESDMNRASLSAQRTRDLFLRADGEEVEVWFNGTPDTEPLMVKVHTVKLDNRFSVEVCGEGVEGHGGCVLCWAAANGDKRISKATRNAVLNTVDTRWVHKVKNEAKTAAAGGKFDKFDWTDCPDDSSCKLCRAKVERERGGQKKMRFGLTAVNALDGTNDQLRKKCANCGGKIRLTGYKNGKRIVPDLDDVADPSAWEPMYECTKCDNPTPGSIFSCPIIVRRNGTGMSTSYSFTPGPFEAPPDWVLELEPIDLETAMVPKTSEKQAEILGVRNPYAGAAGGGRQAATSYDDDGGDPFGA